MSHSVAADMVNLRAREEHIIEQYRTLAGPDGAWEAAYDQLKIQWLALHGKIPDGHTLQELQAYPVGSEVIALNDDESQAIDAIAERLLRRIARHEGENRIDDKDLPAAFVREAKGFIDQRQAFRAGLRQSEAAAHR